MSGLKTECSLHVLSVFIYCPCLFGVTGAALRLWSWSFPQQQSRRTVVMKYWCRGHWHRQWSTATLPDTPWLLGSFVPSISLLFIQGKFPELHSFVLGVKGEDARWRKFRPQHPLERCLETMGWAETGVEACFSSTALAVMFSDRLTLYPPLHLSLFSSGYTKVEYDTWIYKRDK